MGAHSLPSITISRISPPAVTPGGAQPHTGPALHPSRALLQKRPSHYLAQGRRGRADLRLVKLRNTLWVAKDYAGRPWWFRWLLGRWLVARELAALRRLQGLPGFPQEARRIDAYAFAYHYVEGTPLAQASAQQLSPDFFRRYEALLERMHRRGIVHLGLHQESNVLLTAGQHPLILDFRLHLRLPRWLAAVTALLGRLDFQGLQRSWNRYLLAVLRAEHDTRSRA